MGTKEKKQAKEKDLEGMTVKELREVAAESTDLVGVHAMKKADLLAAIKKAKEIKEEKPPKEKIEKPETGVNQIKAKIVDLKRRREEAREAGDRRMSKILKRRIHRAKKRMRKISQA